MDYRQALDYILGFANFEITEPSRLKYREFNLDRVRDLLCRLGDPHEAYPTVHIAGTKGKGSTAAMVASILTAAGYRTGLYTSPHLHTMRERVAVDSVSITEAAFCEGVMELQSAISRMPATGEQGRVSTFEAMTALAFWRFAQEQVAYAVVEVGLGGRLDATNVLRPQVCAITNISLDHTDLLGETLGAIAGEKAAIIKTDVPVVCAPQPLEVIDVVRRTAEGCGAPLTLMGKDVTWERVAGGIDGQRAKIETKAGAYDVRLPLPGSFQIENAAIAIGIIEALNGQGANVPHDAIIRGLAEVSWPGRMEVLARRPTIVADGAHNPYSLACVLQALQEDVPCRMTTVIFGANRGKAIPDMLRELSQRPVSVIVTQSRHPKASPVEDVVREAEALGIPVGRANDTAAAIEMALRVSNPDDLIVACGSLFIAAEAREHILGIEPELYPAATQLLV